MGYTATITTASLRIRESRIIARLLLAGVTEQGWSDAIYEENVLQMGSEESIKRISRLLRARMEPLGADIWTMVSEGDRTQTTQAVMAGAIKNSRLLGDFMDLTLREQRALFSNHLEPKHWSSYIEGCRGRDPEMPHWSETTLSRLRSAVFSMLAEAGYLEDTKTLAIQGVYVDEQLSAALRDQGERYVLRCLEVCE